MQTIFRTYQKGTFTSALTSTKSVLNAQSYKHARYYDSDIARFLSTDPWADKYPSWSTYNYVMGNPVMLIDPTGKGTEDWVQKANGSIYWDKNANSQGTTKTGETYLGKTLNFKFESYIDANLWDGPMGNIAAGVKLTSEITIKTVENSVGEISGVSASYKVTPGKTPIGSPRMFYPGEGGSHNVRTAECIYKSAPLLLTVDKFRVNFEQHASVSVSEEMGLKEVGYKIVDVAQKLNIVYSKNHLWIGSYTDIFPSASLSVNGHKIMQYNQPSFESTHKAPTKGDYMPPFFRKDFSYYPSKLYFR